jgi:endonuclease-3
MTSPSRTAQFAKVHRVLKKYYKPVLPNAERPVLEHLLFACCLENAHYEKAEEAFAALVHTFFDFNEIRVSSVRELSEVLARLPHPSAAANRVKRVLQNIFEATYSFDLESLRKLNLGPAVERLEAIEGTSKFSVAYAVQAALGGHSIPLDAGTLAALRLVDLATDEDLSAGVVSGLERAIPKHAGTEFASILHQLGADFVASPYAPSLHHLLVEIEPVCAGRLPSRRARRVDRDGAAAPAAPPAPGSSPGDAKSKKPPRRPEAKDEPKPPAREPAKEPGKEAAKEAAKEPAGEAKKKPVPAKKRPEDEPAEAKAAPPAEPAPKKKDPPAEPREPAGAKKKAESPPKKPPVKKKVEGAKGESEAEAGRQESPAEGLAKRKPR